MQFRYIVSLFLSISFFSTADMAAQSSRAVDSTLKELGKIKDDSLRLDAIFAYNRQLWETDPSQTTIVIQAALEDAQRLDNSFFIGKSYSAFGYTYLLAADYPRALKYFLDALTIWKQRGDNTREVETIIFISDIHTKNGDLQKAKQFAEQAISIVRKHRINHLEAKALNQLAIIYERMDRPLVAMSFYQEGIAAAKRERDKYFEAFLLGNIATSYKKLGKLDLSLTTYRSVLDIGDSLHDPYITAVAAFNIAETYFETGQLEESRTFALQALSVASQIKETETLAGAYGLLKRIAIKSNDYKLAVDYFTKETAIRDTVFNQQKAAQLAQMQTRFDTRLKDEKISDQHIQIALGRKVNLLLAIVIVLITVAGIFIWLQQRRTSRLHRQVASQKAELSQLNDVKDRIFSVISHDMRTPVNSIIAFMQLLEQDNMTQEKLKAYSTELKSSMADTATLLENLLNWAKSQMQGFKPVIEDINIQQLVSDTIQLLGREMLVKNITVRQTIPAGLLAKADWNMTAIVLRNLLHNAVKFSPPGGVINIEAVNTTGSTTDLLIHDNGRGFNEQAVTAFNNDPLNKPGSTMPGTANEQGTGLGLLLCKTFLKQMNCSLHLESTAGKGSTFIVRFPAPR